MIAQPVPPPATPLRPCPPPERLDSERILLLRHDPNGVKLAEAMFSVVDADRARLREFLPWVDSTLTAEDSRGYLRMAREQWDQRALFDYGIFGRDDGAFLGGIGVHAINWGNRRCEIGYWIRKSHEGRGLVAEASRLLEAALFGIGFNRIEIHCSSINARSAAVPARRGFRLEGTLRQDGIEHGAYRDTLVYAKIASDPR